MNPNLRTKAEKLAERPYVVQVVLDETTDGEPIYVARNPELEGCFGQGETIEQAVADLREARIDYIESLLEDDLSIPERITTVTTSAGSVTFTISYQGETREDSSRVVHDADERLISLHEAPLLTLFV